MSNITASAAVVTWLPGPTNTSRYRILVTYTNSSTYVVLEKNITQQPFSYTYQLENLSSGSRYDVTVFAIKCDRDVYNPQEVSFYTSEWRSGLCFGFVIISASRCCVVLI